MKKIFLVSIVTLFALQSFTQLFGQAKKDIKVKHVPDNAISALNTKYGADVIAKWDRKGSDYFATFEIDKVNYEAEFSNEGGWLQTEKQVTEADLPDAVNEALFSGGYQDWTKAELMFIEKTTGENMYRASVIKGDKKRSILITPDGKVTDSERL